MDDHHERRSIVERSKISDDRSVNPQVTQEDATQLTESSKPDKASGHPSPARPSGAPTLNPLNKGEAHEQA